MASTLDTDPVARIVSTLYENARSLTGGFSPGGPRRPLESSTAAEQAKAAEDRYMAVSPTGARLMYSLVHAARPTTVVEFGMSYGISTLHLAAAVRDNGVGHVYTTELSEKKVTAASTTFADAGLDDVVTILDGDALETLQSVSGEIGFAFLDGWKGLYLPVFRLIEDQLPSGALVLADNTESPDLIDYLAYVRDPGNGYVSLNFPGKGSDTMELTCRV
ncbi:O-methyltransferase [Gordonia sputi]